MSNHWFRRFFRDDFIIASPHPIAKTQERLAEVVSLRTFLKILVPEKPFAGEINGNDFKIYRTIDTRSGRSSAGPRILGRLEAAGNGTRIHLSIRLGWAFIYLIGFLLVLEIMVVAERQLSFGAIPIIIVAILTLACEWTRRYTRKLLLNAFEGSIEDPNSNLSENFIR